MVSRKEQILMMSGGLMVAIGFMFMGAASLSGLTPDDPASPGQGQQEIDAEMPTETFSESGYGLGINEQTYLAFNNQVVFVNAIYEDEPDFEYLEGLDEEFEDRVYISYENASDSAFLSQAQGAGLIQEDVDLPMVIVVGDQQTEQGPFISRAQEDRESVRETVCNAMRDVGDAAAICF